VSAILSSSYKIKSLRGYYTLHREVTVAAQYTNNIFHRELVMDALPMLDTSAATATMAQLYAVREGQVPYLRHWLEHRAAQWFASLAYTRRPTTEMLQATLVH
jgi:hypothetical protein